MMFELFVDVCNVFGAVLAAALLLSASSSTSSEMRKKYCVCLVYILVYMDGELCFCKYPTSLPLSLPTLFCCITLYSVQYTWHATPLVDYYFPFSFLKLLQ